MKPAKFIALRAFLFVSHFLLLTYLWQTPRNVIPAKAQIIMPPLKFIRI